MATKDSDSKAVVVRPQRQINPVFRDPAPLPEELAGLIDVRAWIESLTKGVDYKEPNPDFMSQRMMMLTLSARNLDELLSDPELDGLQKLIPDAPWQGTGPIIITGLYVAKSDLSDGQKTYMLLEWFNTETGAETTTTTGATRLQLLFAGMLAMGHWPIEGTILRTDRKDRGGRHLFTFHQKQ